MRRLVFALIVGVLGLTVACSASTGSGTAITSTSPDAPVVRQLDPGEFADQVPERLTINVHIPDEGSIPDTDLTLPYNQIDARQAELPGDRNTALAIYCMSGNMSAIAGDTLAELGYTDIVELRGGMQAWRAAGLPFVPAA